MRKRKILYVFVALILSVGCLAVFSSCSPAAGDNLFTNGDFYLRNSSGGKILSDSDADYYKLWTSAENPDIPYGWEFNSKIEGSGQLKQLPKTENNGVVYDAINFFEIEHGTTASHSRIKQQLSVKKNTYYKLSFEYQTWGTTAISNLKFVFGEDISHQPFGVSINTGRNDYQLKWNESTATVNTRDFDKLTVYILFGGDCSDIFFKDSSGNSAPSGSLPAKWSTGFCRIKNIKAVEIPMPTTATQTFALGIDNGTNGKNANLIKNPDLLMRDELGTILKDGEGFNRLDCDANENPLSWSVSSSKPAAAEVKVKKEDGTSYEGEGSFTSRNNHIRIIHSDYNYTTVTQRVNVKKGSCYQISYYLYIPGGTRAPVFSGSSDSIKFAVYPAILQDRDYIIQPALWNHVFNDPTGIQSGSRWIFSNKTAGNYFNVVADRTGEMDIGISLGSSFNPVKGEVWFYAFRVMEVDPATVSIGNRYAMQTNSGFDSSKTGKIITLSFLTLFTAALFAGAVFLAANALSKKKGDGQNEPEDNSPAPAARVLTVNEPLYETAHTPEAFAPSIPTAVKLFPMALIVFAAGLIVRIAATFMVSGDRVNLDALIAMASAIQASGLKSLIGSGYFIEPLKALFLGLASFMDTSGAGFMFVCKLPNILADIGIAFVLTLFAGKNKKLGLMLAAVYLANPFSMLAAVSFKFSTVALLLLLLTVYCLINKKYLPMFACYTAALLTDANALIAAPVLLLYVVSRAVIGAIYVAANKKDAKAALLSEQGRQLWLMPLCAVCALIIFYLVSLPVTVSAPLGANPFKVFGYYFIDGASASGLFTKNGLSLFTMLNMNGTLLSEKFSAGWYAFSMSLIVIAAAGVMYLLRKKKNSIIILLSVIFSALFLSFFLAGTSELTGAALFALFLAAFAVTKDKRMLTFAFAFSLISFANLFLSLMYAYDFSYLPAYLLSGSVNPLFDGGVYMNEGAVRIISIALSTLYLVLMGFYVYVLIGILFKDRSKLLFSQMPKRNGAVSFKDSLSGFFGKR